MKNIPPNLIERNKYYTILSLTFLRHSASETICDIIYPTYNNTHDYILLLQITDILYIAFIFHFEYTMVAFKEKILKINLITILDDDSIIGCNKQKKRAINLVGDCIVKITPEEIATLLLQDIN